MAPPLQAPRTLGVRDVQWSNKNMKAVMNESKAGPEDGVAYLPQFANFNNLKGGSMLVMFKDFAKLLSDNETARLTDFANGLKHPVDFAPQRRASTKASKSAKKKRTTTPTSSKKPTSGIAKGSKTRPTSDKVSKSVKKETLSQKVSSMTPKKSTSIPAVASATGSTSTATPVTPTLMNPTHEAISESSSMSNTEPALRSKLELRDMNLHMGREGMIRISAPRGILRVN